MLMFQQLSSLKSAKRWFYFLRFLRLSAVLDDSKTEAYRRNTAEWMKDIFSVFTVQSDAAINELCRLMQFVFSVDGLRQYPTLMPILFRSFQEGDYFTEVPSLILEVTRHHAQYSKHDVTKLLEERRSIVLSDFVLAESVFNFLNHNPGFLTKVDPYLSSILDCTSPLFAIGWQLATQLIPLCSSSLRSYDTLIAHIRISGYSLPSAIPVSSAYFRAMMRAFAAHESPHRFEVQELGQLTELFLTNPSISNWRLFAQALADSSEYCDSLRLLVERLVGTGHGFIFVLLISNQHFTTSADFEQARFVSLLADTGGIHPKSRKVALLRASERKIDDAFWAALAETDDDAVLAQIAHKFDPPS
jgi:hypothetical protein